MNAGNIGELEKVLQAIAKEFPVELQLSQLANVPRMAFNIRLISSRVGRSAVVCDVGGGLSMFAMGCAVVGMKAIMVDDFSDQPSLPFVQRALELNLRYGVEVRTRDVIASGLGAASDAFDAVTCFESMEHWHHSPRGLFHEVMKALVPRGVFVLSAPNCVNLRKRFAFAFGTGRWSPIEDWYDAPEFRGHVREPKVSDLQHIAGDLKLADVEIVGRNWLGYKSDSPVIRRVTPFCDHILRLRPSLCTNLYLIGRKTQFGPLLEAGANGNP